MVVIYPDPELKKIPNKMTEIYLKFIEKIERKLFKKRLIKKMRRNYIG